MTIDPYILQQASCRASLLVATAGFTWADWEDLRQDILVDCLRRMRNFDPARGDWHGFVRGVTRNQATVLVIRARRRVPEVLDRDLIHQQDASDVEWLDTLDKRSGRKGVVDALHLSIDVRRVLESLPVQLQSLAGLLGQMPVQDVCRHTGRSRSRVYQMTRQIREAFIAAGMGSNRGSARESNAKREPSETRRPRGLHFRGPDLRHRNPETVRKLGQVPICCPEIA
jgi:RNA polymerase sigma-70 factor, ECF subfamily